MGCFIVMSTHILVSELLPTVLTANQQNYQAIRSQAHNEFHNLIVSVMY